MQAVELLARHTRLKDKVEIILAFHRGLAYGAHRGVQAPLIGEPDLPVEDGLIPSPTVR